MTVLPMGDILTIAAHEYDKPCEGSSDCDHAAEWMAWVKHNINCETFTGFSCSECKVEAEAHWIGILKAKDRCGCGHRHVGQLSDNIRFIKL